MGNLHRTQIYLDENQMKQLKLEAEREHSDMSKLIRKAIDFFLKARKKNISWDTDPLTKAVGMVELTVHDASEKHDKYLYE